MGKIDELLKQIEELSQKENLDDESRQNLDLAQMFLRGAQNTIDENVISEENNADVAEIETAEPNFVLVGGEPEIRSVSQNNTEPEIRPASQNNIESETRPASQNNIVPETRPVSQNNGKSENRAIVPVTVNKPVVIPTPEQPEEENKDTGKKIVTAIGVIVLLGALAAGGYALIKEAKSGKVKNIQPITPSQSDVVAPTDSRTEEEDNVITLDELMGKDTYLPLTTEEFTNLVAEYADKYNEEYSDVVTTRDIVKFASIANIDMLSEDNRELAKELFAEQSKEEYLNDAAKLIGATVMYNFTKWNNDSSTEEFIRVSDLIFGEQKDKMLKIEEYTDKVADAANKDDADLVNEIVSEFLTDMNSGSLSKLDDGVGFAAQVNIAVIADGIARNYLNQQNFDMFQVLKTSEKYVSNIFTEYEECANSKDDTKTLSK